MDDLPWLVLTVLSGPASALDLAFAIGEPADDVAQVLEGLRTGGYVELTARHDDAFTDRLYELTDAGRSIRAAFVP